MRDFIGWYLSWEILEWLRRTPLAEGGMLLVTAAFAWTWARLRRRPALLHGSIGIAIGFAVLAGFNVAVHLGRSDPRYLAEERVSEFAKQLTADNSQSFFVSCFPTDRSSCEIASRYRDLLATFWRPEARGDVALGPDPELANHVCIVVQSETVRPMAALALRRALLSVGILAGIRTNPQLKANEFNLLVGPSR